MKKISPFLKQCFVTAAVGSNIIGFGCSIGFPAVLLPQLNEPGSIISVSKQSESWIASVFALSGLVGSLIAPPVMDRLGRKIAHYVLGLIFIVGWFMIILSTSVEIIIIGRILKGIAGGILNTLRSILIGEYTSPKNRGAFLTTVSLSQSFGIFFVHLMGSLVSWQMTALVCVFFPFISFIMTIYTPESPSWLLVKGDHDECRKVFKWLRGDDENEELEDMIQARIGFEKAQINSEKVNKLSHAIEIARKKEFYKPILIIFLGNCMMHYAGGTTMASYSTVIISLLMGPTANAHFWMVFLDTQRIISNSIAVYIINRVNRRTMVMFATSICILSHVTIAIYAYSRHLGWDYSGIWLPALLINIQLFSVAIGMVPMPNVIAGEIFTLEYRSVGGTISMITGGGVMFAVLKTFPAILDGAGLHGTYAIFAVLLALSLLVLLVILPETKGKTLQHIEDELRGAPLKLEEIEARKSLQSNPVEAYKRKMSERSFSGSLL